MKTEDGTKAQENWQCFFVPAPHGKQLQIYAETSRTLRCRHVDVNAPEGVRVGDRWKDALIEEKESLDVHDGMF